MPVAPHFEARRQFLAELDAFFARGCAHWQQHELGWRPADELGEGERAKPLMVATFVREVCGEAAHKFWIGMRKGAEDADRIAMRTPRVFEQLLERMVRTTFISADEADTLRGYFNLHYWPIEDAWLKGQRTKENRAMLFAQLGGPEAVAKISTDVQAFYTWSHDLIYDAYASNNYQRALQLSEAIVMEAAALVGGTFSDEDVVLGLCAVQEAARIGTTVRLNCWAPEPGAFVMALDDVVRDRVSAAMLDGPTRHDLGRFATTATVLKTVCARFEAPTMTEPSLLAIYHLLGYIRFHQKNRDMLAGEVATPIDSLTVTLMLTELVNRRSDWLRAYGFYGRMRDVPGFEAKVHNHLAAALGDEGEEPGLVVATLAFMAEPHRLIEAEWAAMENGVASREGWNDVALAVLAAKVRLHPDVLDLPVGHDWLNVAKDKLTECSVLLAWSDFYCTCDTYMQERGNPILCDYALNNVRKLQQRAGNANALAHFKDEVLAVASRRKRKAPTSETPDDIDLQWFLRDEPPPLSSKRGSPTG